MHGSKILSRTKLSRLPLWLELTLALLLKLTILYFLWQIFFSQPQTTHMALPVLRVEQHLLNTAPSVPAASVSGTTISPSSPSHLEASHGTH